MRSRIPYLLLAVAAIFAAGFVSNVVDGEVDWAETAAQLGIIGLAAGAYWFVRHEERLRNELLAFLTTNADAIRAGTAVYRGHPISYATRLRSCEIILSFLLVTFRFRSRLIVDGSESDRGLRSGCSLVTFLFGWWAFPLGPLWTPRALYNNMRGATVQSVGEVLEGRSELVVPVARSRR